MLVDFKLQELGENIGVADVVRVLVKVGDSLRKDQTVLELETEKAVFELPSTLAGVVKEVSVKAGDKIKVGQLLFRVEEQEGAVKTPETVPSKKEKESLPAKTEAKPRIEEKEKKEEVKKEAATTPEEVKTERPPPFRGEGIFAAPIVRRIARELGVDLSGVSPSGDGGRLTVEDVKRHYQTVSAAPATAASGLRPSSLPDFSQWGPVERKPMSNVRRTTAQKMSEAWLQIPHVTQFDQADITELERLRKRFAKRAEAAGGHLSLTAILLKVAASALKVFPQMNASVDLEKEEIVYKNYFHIGIAVDTDRGLLAPVLRDVGEKNILEIAVELRTITEKARARKLTLAEMQGASFTITNLGNIGGGHFTPIIHWPQVAILGVGRARVEPVWEGDKWEPRTMLPLSLSYDHRLIDGADGARFLRWLAEAVQQPFLMDLEG
ncbi:MAG: 2-oxo acid dehydrogenase subunit E2 [bacterium]